jgi:hypothetical protein
MSVAHAGAALLVIAPPGVEQDAGLVTPITGANDPLGAVPPGVGADVRGMAGDVRPGMSGEVRPDMTGDVRADTTGGTAPSNSSSGCSLPAPTEAKAWGTVASLALLIGSLLRRVRRRRQNAPRPHLFLL